MFTYTARLLGDTEASPFPVEIARDGEIGVSPDISLSDGTYEVFMPAWDDRVVGGFVVTAGVAALAYSQPGKPFFADEARTAAVAREATDVLRDLTARAPRRGSAN